MTESIDELFSRYERKLEKELGAIEVGQLARWRRWLVQRLGRDEFEARWLAFRQLEADYRRVIAAGATATNEMYDEVREQAAQLLLVESAGAFWW